MPKVLKPSLFTSNSNPLLSSHWLATQTEPTLLFSVKKHTQTRVKVTVEGYVYTKKFLLKTIENARSLVVFVIVHMETGVSIS